jgi:hypothetical protein
MFKCIYYDLRLLTIRKRACNSDEGNENACGKFSGRDNGRDVGKQVWGG